MHSSTPPIGWEHDDVRPLSSKPNFHSIDIPGNPGLADPNQPKDPELFATAQVVLEAVSRIHDLPARCDCGERFQGVPSERRYTLIGQQGNGADPEVRTVCGTCYDRLRLPAPTPEEDYETKLVRFAHDGGATQKQIAAMFGLSQSSVCRILKRIKLAK